MDSSSNEADETIRYLYRLDELDEILAANQRILTEIQNAEGKRGTSSSLSNLRTRQSDIDAIRAKLRARCEKLREEIYPIRCVLLLCIDWHGSRPNRRGYFRVEGSC